MYRTASQKKRKILARIVFPVNGAAMSVAVFAVKKLPEKEKPLSSVTPLDLSHFTGMQFCLYLMKIFAGG